MSDRHLDIRDEGLDAARIEELKAHNFTHGEAVRLNATGEEAIVETLILDSGKVFYALQGRKGAVAADDVQDSRTISRHLAVIVQHDGAGWLVPISDVDGVDESGNPKPPTAAAPLRLTGEIEKHGRWQIGQESIAGMVEIFDGQAVMGEFETAEIEDDVHSLYAIAWTTSASAGEALVARAAIEDALSSQPGMRLS